MGGGVFGGSLYFRQKMGGMFCGAVSTLNIKGGGGGGLWVLFLLQTKQGVGWGVLWRCLHFKQEVGWGVVSTSDKTTGGVLCGVVSTLNMKVVGVGVFGVSHFRPPQKEMGRGGVLNRWGNFYFKHGKWWGGGGGVSRVGRLFFNHEE